MRPLGETQHSVLQSLKRSGGFWYAGCGWYWDTFSGTARIMESLLRRGLVTKADGRANFGPKADRYDLTEAGKKAAQQPHRTTSKGDSREASQTPI